MLFEPRGAAFYIKLFREYKRVSVADLKVLHGKGATLTDYLDGMFSQQYNDIDPSMQPASS